MPIRISDLGADEDLGRRILVRARIIAPCLDSFADGSEEKRDAIAILKGVIAELPDPGSRRAKSLSRNGTSISYTEIQSAFDADAVESLRSLCGRVSAGAPVGSFPTDRPLARVWREGPYT